MTLKRHHSIKTMLIIFPLIFMVSLLDLLPWWSFVVPVLALGAVIGYRQWQVASFSTGFLAGFITWCVTNACFMIARNNHVLNKIGLLIGMPGIVVLVISGLIGGLLTGLALYTGKYMTAPETPGANEFDKV